jgi:hypothetical protein
MLRRQAVVDRDDRAAAVGAEPATEVVVAVEVAEDVAAAVVVHDGAAVGSGTRGVDADRDGRAAHAVDAAVFGADVGRRHVGCGEDLAVQGAARNRRQVGEVGCTGGAGLFQHRRDVLVEHGMSFVQGWAGRAAPREARPIGGRCLDQM